MGAHRRGWQYIRFILDDSVIRLSVLPVKSVTLQAVEFPNSPCGLSRVYYAYAYGGVSSAYANYGASNTNADIGSRLEI